MKKKMINLFGILCLISLCQGKHPSRSIVVEVDVEDPHPIVSVQPRHVHLALAEEEESLSVSWSTINKTEESLVLVYTKHKELSYVGDSVLFVDGGAKQRSQWIHKVIITGLEANSSYRYRVGSSMGWSDVFTMQTLPSGLTKIVFNTNCYLI